MIYRHRCELEALEESDPDAFERAQQEEEEAAVAAKEPPPEESKKGSGGGEGKKSKAQRRREKERAKEKEREERIALEKAGAGPSPRDVELRAINERLAAGIPGESPYGPVPPLAVHEVLSDGHCLYRSVDHQLTLRGQGPVRQSQWQAAAAGGSYSPCNSQIPEAHPDGYPCLSPRQL